MQSADLLVIIDRSGSMYNIAEDMSGGLNKLIEEQKKLAGKCRLTLVQFDSESVDNVYVGADISEYTGYQLSPRNSTPLFDAIVRGTATFDDMVKKNGKLDRTVCVIITDGQENASREAKSEDVISLLKDKQENEKWDIVYLGADHDVITASQQIGVQNGFSYSKSSGSVNNVYGTLHKKMSDIRVRSASLDFSEQDIQCMSSDISDESAWSETKDVS